jgi:hypothetical protein
MLVIRRVQVGEILFVVCGLKTPAFDAGFEITHVWTPIVVMLFKRLAKVKKFIKR